MTSAHVGAMFERERQGGGTTTLNDDAPSVLGIRWLIVVDEDLVATSFEFAFQAERHLEKKRRGEERR